MDIHMTYRERREVVSTVSSWSPPKGERERASNPLSVFPLDHLMVVQSSGGEEGVDWDTPIAASGETKGDLRWTGGRPLELRKWKRARRLGKRV